MNAYGIILPCLKLKLLICQTEFRVTKSKIWNTLKVRNIPQSSIASPVHTFERTLNLSSPNKTLHILPHTKISTVFLVSHFLEGVNLTGGTPLVEWVECLGVAGTLGEIPLSIGWGASVEMIGLVRILTLLSLYLVAGGVTPPIGITGNIDSTFIRFKESEECTLNFPSEFHGCASACSLKCEGRSLGFSIVLVLSMELSGNLIQYESGSDAAWSIVPVFHMFPCTS